MTAFFPYELDERWNPMFRVLGVDDTQGVEITDDGVLRATFGRKSIETPLTPGRP